MRYDESSADLPWKVVYVPPVNKWPTPSAWAMFTFAVESPIAKDEQDRTIMVQSEPGIVVMTNPHRQIAGSDFSLANSADGWTLSGQLEVVGGNMPSQGVRHQAVAWGGLSHYIYGVDEVQSLDFATGIDLAKWYFEASPQVFYRKESDGKVMCFRHWPCAGCWGGKVRRAEKNIEAS
ncbi:unnamed protein product [Cladocopium goreaui]|uniref:DnaJ-like subfamily B member 5 n=1 Tax=Cladocopium goreaui TaxID=2562237 RepID=A0A9P1DAJ0_9DINO|nr:unnamed protein product [Cladocopium goreaui]